MKKIFAMALMLIFTISALAGCATTSASAPVSGNGQSGNNFDASKHELHQQLEAAHNSLVVLYDGRFLCPK